MDFNLKILSITEDGELILYRNYIENFVYLFYTKNNLHVKILTFYLYDSYDNFIISQDKKIIFYSSEHVNYKIMIDGIKKILFFKNPDGERTISINCSYISNNKYVSIKTERKIYLLKNEKLYHNFNIDLQYFFLFNNSSFSSCGNFYIYQYKSTINIFNLENKNTETLPCNYYPIGCLKMSKLFLVFFDDELKILNLKSEEITVIKKTSTITSINFFKEKYLIYAINNTKIVFFDIIENKIITTYDVPNAQFSGINDNKIIFYSNFNSKSEINFNKFFHDKTKVCFIKEENFPTNIENNYTKDFFSNVLYDKNLLPLIFNFLE